MKISRIYVLLASLTLFGFAVAEDKGSCPSPPPRSAFAAPNKATAPLDSADKNSVTVTVLTVVSDTGYVCSAQVLHGVEKDADLEAVNSVRKSHFNPAMKNGRAVPVVVTVAVKFLRNKDGKLVLTPSGEATPSTGTLSTEP